MVDELLAARGIIVSYETVRQWALKFGPRPGANTMSLMKPAPPAPRRIRGHKI